MTARSNQAWAWCPRCWATWPVEVLGQVQRCPGCGLRYCGCCNEGWLLVEPVGKERVS